LATFDHYIIMDDVTVTNLENVTALAISGPGTRQVLRAAGIEVPEARPLQVVEAKCTCQCECTTCTAVRGEDAAHESYEVWLAGADVRKTWDALVQHGATPVGFEALELQRVAQGIPLYGVDIGERDLPQETEQMRALNFSKGCYIGQEIVERIRSRGSVHRKFTGFIVEGPESVAAGTKISVNDKEVGEITSVASVPLALGEKTVALGYIRREQAAPGQRVAIGTSAATVTELPLPDEFQRSERSSLEHRSA
jgi:aminomethyltransferase